MARKHDWFVRAALTDELLVSFSYVSEEGLYQLYSDEPETAEAIVEAIGAHGSHIEAGRGRVVAMFDLGTLTPDQAHATVAELLRTLFATGDVRESVQQPLAWLLVRPGDVIDVADDMGMSLSEDEVRSVLARMREDALATGVLSISDAAIRAAISSVLGASRHRSGDGDA